MDDQRDYAEEAANRADMEREGREEYEAEQKAQIWADRANWGFGHEPW